MHDTAYQIGGLVMDTYLPLFPAKILEIGAQNVNGTLRDHAPRNAEYIGLDFEAGSGVDIVIKDVSDWPVPDAHFDLVIASSVFEHDKTFWRTFIEMCKKTKPGGHIYISAPSNGTVHRYPKDYWRFYPDSGLALEEWARSEGFDISLVESFISERKAEVWNDFSAVFRCGPTEHDLNRDFVYEKLPFTNALTWRSSLVINQVDDTEDTRLLGEARAETQGLVRHTEYLVATSSEREDGLKQEIENLRAEDARLRAHYSAEIEQRSNQILQLEQEIELQKASITEAGDAARMRAEELTAEIEAMAAQARSETEQSQQQIKEFSFKLSEMQSRLTQREEEAAQAWRSADQNANERDALASEIEKTRRSLVDANGWVERLALTRTLLERRVSGLENTLQQLTKNLERTQYRNSMLEKRVASLGADRKEPYPAGLTAQPSPWVKNSKEIASVDKNLNEMRKLISEKDDIYKKLSEANTLLLQKDKLIKENIADISKMADLLAAVQDKSIKLEKDNKIMRESGKVILDYRRWWWRFIPFSLQIKRRNRKLSKMEIFNEDAYVRNNPDVILSGQDPFRHYFYHGIAEGRQPF